MLRFAPRHAVAVALIFCVGWQRPFTQLRPPAAGLHRKTGRLLRIPRGAAVNPGMSRQDLKSSIFNALDQDGDRRLASAEMRTFAELSGFEGDDADWQEEFQMLCDPQGCDFNAFGQLLDDESEDGLFCSDAELIEMLEDLVRRGVASGNSGASSTPRRSLAPATEVGLEYFQREREAGIYDGEWKAWNLQEGTTARTPRIGKVDALEGCPSSSTVQEAIMFVNEQVQNGIFGDQSGQAGNRLSELLAIQGATGRAGWFEFRIDENVLDEEQLAEMVLAPEGWQVDKSTIPTGYMMHIMSVGNGVKATLCGREGSHIINSLHRDVSKCKRLCDTGLCGVVGRKRVVLLAPDVFPASGKVLRSPDMECPELKPLSSLAEEDAWQKLEALAKTPGKGGVLDLEPGMFVFVPHGWWHAVRPIDDFTFITGPSQLSNLGVSTAS